VFSSAEYEDEEIPQQTDTSSSSSQNPTSKSRESSGVQWLMRSQAPIPLDSATSSSSNETNPLKPKTLLPSWSEMVQMFENEWNNETENYRISVKRPREETSSNYVKKKLNRRRCSKRS